jgi:hypothetical protein
MNNSSHIVIGSQLQLGLSSGDRHCKLGLFFMVTDNISSWSGPGPVSIKSIHSSPTVASSSASSSTECTDYGGTDPSPSLTKRLLTSAAGRKHTGRHVLTGGVLRLTDSPRAAPAPARLDFDRWGIPDDLYDSLLDSASRVKRKSGQHELIRRRVGGLNGHDVTQVLISNRISPDKISSYNRFIYSPNPSLF